jgi:CRP/FNR family cyclic AMP-dependent transcriptional regulator
MSSSLAGPSSGPHSTDLHKLIENAVPKAQSETHEILARTARIRSALPNDLIYSQGEPIPLTLATRGYGSFRRTTSEGRQLVLGLATRGDLFGFSAISSRNSPVDLLAVTEGEFALWSGQEVRALAADDPGFAFDIIDGLTRFMVDITSRFDGFIHQDARERVLRVLARYADLFFGPSAILSRSHLPSLVGTSREMTGRVIRDLEREGVVARVGRSGLRLLSPARLNAAADSQGGSD